MFAATVRPVSTGSAHSPSAVSQAAGESFVPLRKDELVELLVRHGALNARESDEFRQLCGLIETLFHHEFHARQEQLKRLYAPFDPDSDVRPLRLRGSMRRELIDEFLGAFADTLAAAHYYPLTPQQLDYALSGTTHWGLDLQINREIFDRLLIYARGDMVCTRKWCDATTWFRTVDVETAIFHRLVLAVKLRPSRGSRESADSHDLYLKMFRDIPKLDLEMLLPGTRPRMRWLDATKIGGSSMTGLYGLLKMAMATLFGKLTWAMIAVGAFSYALNSFFGYRRTKAQYVYSMTQQLYYQNLDNNSGVFCRIIDEAEDEETKEAILAYFFLWRSSSRACEATLLGQQIEKLLTDCTGDLCRFDPRDAIAKLERLGLLTAEHERLCVVPPRDAIPLVSQRFHDCVQHAAGLVSTRPNDAGERTTTVS